MPWPKNAFSPLRYCNSEFWKLTFSCVSCVLFRISDPSLPYSVPILKLPFIMIIPRGVIFYLWSYSNVYCSSECNFINWSACTGDTSFNFYLFYLSWFHSQTLSAVLLFLDKTSVGEDEEQIVQGYGTILHFFDDKNLSISNCHLGNSYNAQTIQVGREKINNSDKT